MRHLRLISLSAAAATTAAALLVAARAEPGFDASQPTPCAQALCSDYLVFHGRTYAGSPVDPDRAMMRGVVRRTHLHDITVATRPRCGCAPAHKITVARIDRVDDHVAVATYPGGDVCLRVGATIPAALHRPGWLRWVPQ